MHRKIQKKFSPAAGCGYFCFTYSFFLFRLQYRLEISARLAEISAGKVPHILGQNFFLTQKFLHVNRPYIRMQKFRTSTIGYFTRRNFCRPFTAEISAWHGNLGQKFL